MRDFETILGEFNRALGDAVVSNKVALGELTIEIKREKIVEAAHFARETLGFDMLADLCGADRGVEEDPRFEVNYHLLSISGNERIRLKVSVPEADTTVESVSGVWKTANWHERETYDLVGIIFSNHPDLRRILLPSDFDGHALRKDYPLRGFEPYAFK